MEILVAQNRTGLGRLGGHGGGRLGSRAATVLDNGFVGQSAQGTGTDCEATRLEKQQQEAGGKRAGTDRGYVEIPQKDAIQYTCQSGGRNEERDSKHHGYGKTCRSHESLWLYIPKASCTDDDDPEKQRRKACHCIFDSSVFDDLAGD